jgi:type VI protein secretion system component VasK
MAGSLDTGGLPLSEKKVVRLDQHDASEQQQRLQYVCRLIRRARQPLCPINGVLTLLPFGLIQRSAPEGIEVQRAVKRDLETLVRGLMVRFPVTAMVVGLEEESGFRELVRRVGRDRARGQRFGKGFSLWNPPTPDRLEAVAAHACGAFEDWVYTLFREKGALSKPGNTKLYALLCKIRRNVQGRLAGILAGAYAAENDPDRLAGSPLFGGCYFAAVGPTEDRQAFVKSVLDKLPQQQEDLEWTDDALREDDRYQRLALWGLGVDMLLLSGLVGLILHKWFPFWR